MKRQRVISGSYLGSLSLGVLCALGAAGDVQALTLPEPARLTAEVNGGEDKVALLAGPWSEAGTATEDATGHVRHRAWKIADPALSTAELTGELSDRLQAEGFRQVFDCADRTCGGFDFRYQLDVIPEPDMHVDLGDFRYLMARRDAGPKPEYAVLIVSRSNSGAFVQLTEVTAKPETQTVTPSVAGAVTLSAATSAPSPSSVAPSGNGDISLTLERDGKIALDDLVFAPGKADLGLGQFASLERLAAYLAVHPDKRITLVGHTDATGPLAANVALSRKRAESVAERLIKGLGVRAEQVEAEGVGFLSPRASNLTEDGRRENRRVEAMLASTRE